MDIERVKWTGKRQFIGSDSAGHSIVMDAPAQYSGEGSGARPLEVFLQALAACTGMDVISILEKKRQDVRNMEIMVNATQRQDEFPKIYTRIEMEYVVTGFGVKPEAVERAIELSKEKYCSVGGMLGPQTQIVTSYQVIESPGAGYAVLDDEGGRHE